MLSAAGRTGRLLHRRRPILLAVLLLVLIALPASHKARAQEGWNITHMAVHIAIQPDGALAVEEVIDVDFGVTQHHGIFRDIPTLLDFDAKHLRRYRIDLNGVTDASGAPIKVQTKHTDRIVRFQIGDPDKTVTGRQSYRIRYRVEGALNPFPDHDELYWNATGVWPVPVAASSVSVTVPGDGIQRAACFQGVSGSTAQCDTAFDQRTATYSATRPLAAGEQVTVVTGLRKGLVPEPHYDLVAKPRTPVEYFDRTPVVFGAAGAVLVAALASLGMLWWRAGRDRRYVTMHYLTEDPREETRPLFSTDPTVVEFEPPEAIRPAQAGLLLDERADTLDLTATIVYLAVRGYLRITELPRTGLFAGLRHKDWQLDRLKVADSGLLDYEQIVLDGLFDRGDSVKMSDLKNRFYTHLQRAQKALYRDATARGWFTHDPDRTRSAYVVAGVAVAAAGAGLAYLLGRWWGAAIVGAPVVLAGLLLTVMARWMPKRTAAGRELLRRILGFRRYIQTAETHRQEFNERAMIFAEYLPYAIVFGCVDRWARAFRDIDTRAAVAGWYAGTSAFDAPGFSRDLQGFAGSVSSTISSTPGGSGASGFSGGSAGGGGGGGGGGAW
jgi:uncharacterized membrane protein YgcG